MFITKCHAIYNETPVLQEQQEYPQYVHLVDAFYEDIKSGFKFPTHNAFNALMDKDTIEELKALAALPGKSAFFLSSGNVSTAGSGVKEAHPDPFVAYKYNMPALAIANIYAGHIANILGWTDNISTDGSCCISSFKSMFDAQNLIKYYGYDRAIIIALEEQTTNALLEFFGKSNATLTKKKMDATGIVPSAFDKKNSGFFLGHGAGYVVIENEKSLAVSGNKPIVKIHAVTVNGEKQTNCLAQGLDGGGFETAIREVILRSGIEKYDLIKAHATGTISNNIAEPKAIRNVFGEDFIATGYKQRVGHTMGACGIVELKLLLDDLKNGVIRGIPNRTAEDHQFLSYDKKMNPKHILVLGSGMGNGFAAMSLESLVNV